MLKNVFRSLRPSKPRRVLNVGGGSKQIKIPDWYEGWDHLLLDIDDRGEPDLVCDARELDTLEGATFDAVYCSHNLEHYYRHDVKRVLAGFHHVLKDDGFADIRVPDINAVMRKAIERRIDIADTLYTSAHGPISVHDVIYGYGAEIEASGNDFYAHKTGFTPPLLERALIDAGFARIFIMSADEIYEVRALAFKKQPTQFHVELLQLPAG